MDIEEYRKQGKEMVDYIANYLKSIRSRHVFPTVKPGYLLDMLPNSAPVEGERFDEIMADVERVLMPGITHWQSPYMHGYFPAINSPASLLGDMLADAIGCMSFTWAASPACTELEITVMDWLAKMIGLPKEFLHSFRDSYGGGVIQTTSSEATLVSFLAARMNAISQLRDIYGYLDDAEINAMLVAYTSDQAHSSVEKASLISMVKMRYIESDSEYRLRADKLKVAIARDKENGLFPFLICATLGTTGSCSFDDLSEIGPICASEGIWLHVDAAYAGTCFVCPEYRKFLEGIEYVTSFAFNPSKWMRVHFDCTAMWVKNSEALHRTFNVNPLYLQYQTTGSAVDFMHWQIPLSRRFRALKLWFVLRNFGVSGLQNHVRKSVGLAEAFEQCLLADERFEIPAKRYLGLVVFRLKDDNEKTETLLRSINDTGLIHCVPACLKNKYVIRYVITSPYTELVDIERDLQLIKEHASRILEPDGAEDVASLPTDLEMRPNFGHSLTLFQDDVNVPKVINASYTAVTPKHNLDQALLAKLGQYISRMSTSSPSLNLGTAMGSDVHKRLSLDSQMNCLSRLRDFKRLEVSFMRQGSVKLCGPCLRKLSVTPDETGNDGKKDTPPVV